MIKAYTLWFATQWIGLIKPELHVPAKIHPFKT
jgi:hypothetical protein